VAADDKLRAAAPKSRFEYMQCDITDADSVARCAAAVKSTFSKLTVLVNNAGIAFKGNAFGANEAVQTMACNLHGTRRMCEAMLPLLTDNARIINVCSMYGAGRGAGWRNAMPCSRSSSQVGQAEPAEER